MNVLIVVAHPDDEVLGCGATGAGLTAGGHSVRSCFLSGNAEARGARPEGELLRIDTLTAQRHLGFGDPIFGEFPNIRMNTVPHIELVRFIESAIETTQAEVIFTHHPSDLNDDHTQTSRACMAAMRLAQRQQSVHPLRRLYFMEILSSTDWSLPAAGNPFQPDTFVEATHLDRKLAALSSYRGVMRPYPHPRSEEVVRALACFRGGQAGLRQAEAFQLAYCAAKNAEEIL